MAMQQFQAESKKLMDLMINSIYTNKEIFLRELISNASDAIDKLYFKSLTDTSVGMNKEDFRILLTLDKENRLLTISDNGIGMTRAELEENLGTIAHSGSQDFKAENTDENIDIIGMVRECGLSPEALSGLLAKVQASPKAADTKEKEDASIEA